MRSFTGFAFAFLLVTGSAAAGCSSSSDGGGPFATGGSAIGGGGSGGGGGAGGANPAAGGGGAAGGRSEITPALPPVNGDCPTFASGTISVGGLAGITLEVGPKKEGTGSLVFYWHGTGSTASEYTLTMPASVRQEILDQGGIIVSFQGSTGTGGDCSGTNTFSKDDFVIADQIAACAVRDHAVDPRRIYATGCSAGGLQAGCMGALRSGYVAAVAPNSGGEIVSLPIQDPAHTPAVMTMHGGSSDMVIVAFSATSARYDRQMKAAGSYVINCDHGGGHCGAPAALYVSAWQFMKDHPFGVQPEPYSAVPASFPTYCAAY